MQLFSEHHESVDDSGPIPSYRGEEKYTFHWRRPMVDAGQIWAFYDKFGAHYTATDASSIRWSSPVDPNKVTIYKFQQRTTFTVSFTLFRESGLPVQVDMDVTLLVKDPVKAVKNSLHTNDGMRTLTSALLAAVQGPLEELLLQDIKLEVLLTISRDPFADPVPLPRQRLSERDVTHYVGLSATFSEYGLEARKVYVKDVHMPDAYNTLMRKAIEVQEELLTIRKKIWDHRTDTELRRKDLAESEEKLRTMTGFIEVTFPAIRPAIEGFFTAITEIAAQGADPRATIAQIETVSKQLFASLVGASPRNPPPLSLPATFVTPVEPLQPLLPPAPPQHLENTRALQIQTLYEMAPTQGWHLLPPLEQVQEVTEGFTVKVHNDAHVFYLTVPRNYPAEDIRVTEMRHNRQRLPQEDIRRMNADIRRSKTGQQNDLYNAAKLAADALCERPSSE